MKDIIKIVKFLKDSVLLMERVSETIQNETKEQRGGFLIALYVQNNDVTYFDSFGVEYIPKEIKAFVYNKNIKTNIFRIQAYDSVMCGYFCIGFIDFMLAGKTLTEFTNLFLPNKFKRNDDKILKYFITNV